MSLSVVKAVSSSESHVGSNDRSVLQNLSSHGDVRTYFFSIIRVVRVSLSLTHRGNKSLFPLWSDHWVNYCLNFFSMTWLWPCYRNCATGKLLRQCKYLLNYFKPSNQLQSCRVAYQAIALISRVVQPCNTSMLVSTIARCRLLTQFLWHLLMTTRDDWHTSMICCLKTQKDASLSYFKMWQLHCK